MSSTIYVNCHTCGSVLNEPKTSLPYGLIPLFKALGVDMQRYEDHPGWEGKMGVQILPALQSAINIIRDDADIGDLKRRYDDHESIWSNVDFTLPFLETMRDAFCQDPYATINVSS